MSKSQPANERSQAAALPDEADLGFEVDEEEIDLDLPDWPGPAEAKRASDTAVTSPAYETAKSGAHTVRADGLEPPGDGLDDDFDLPLPGAASFQLASATESALRSGGVARAGAAAETRHRDRSGAAADEFDIDFDFDAPAPDGAGKSRSAATERPPKQRPAANPAATAAAPKAAPASKAAAAKRKSGPAAGAKKPTPAPAAKKTTRAAQPAQTAAASSPAAASPRLETPAVAADPDLPDDPGYDVLPADSLPANCLPGAPTGAQAESPETPAVLKPRRRPRRWMAAVASVVLIGGLGYLGAMVFGGGNESVRELDAYELARARAAGRIRPNLAGAASKADASSPSAAADAPETNTPPGSPAAADAHQVIEIGVAYGTEKRNWLEWAAEEFAASDAGRQVRVQLIPMGSLESAHAILDGDQRIHVWSPASSLYRESLLRDWEAKHHGNPIVKEEALALTPMVLVMWKSRYEAFMAKCPTISLRTANFAMRAKDGWATIAGRPAWGRFKFGHTHPNQSNSGLMTLIMLACEFHAKKSGLTVSEIMSSPFQDYLTEFRAGVAGVSHSTGTLMKEMTLKGPTCYDALLVYENLAIEYAESAEGRWDALQVIYPEYNLWNENPYCILNTPWTTAEHQRAAEQFLAFLLSEPVQTRALDFGFRPANPRVPVKGPHSPFERYAKYGLTVDLAATCEVPSREVLENLQQSWVRCAPGRPDATR